MQESIFWQVSQSVDQAPLSSKSDFDGDSLEEELCQKLATEKYRKKGYEKMKSQFDILLNYFKNTYLSHLSLKIKII